MPTPDYILDLRKKIGHDPLLLPGVTGVVVDERGHVLLVHSKLTGRWMPVGGIVEPGEEPAVTIVREIKEEANVTAVPERIVSVDAEGPLDYPNGDRASFVTTTFRCRAVAGETRVADEESTNVRYFPPDALPEDVEPKYRRRIAIALNDDPRAAFSLNGRSSVVPSGNPR